MRGFRSESYGDGFADVYDEWYADVTDVGATVELIRSLADARDGADDPHAPDQPPTALELGVGTGRLAIPLARTGVAVTGLDASEAMLDRLRRATDGDLVTTVLGDMVDGLPDGPFDVVFAAYNTFLNLIELDRQAACVAAVARRLSPGGHLVIEAALAPDVDDGHEVGVRTLDADRVVLSVSDHRADQRTTFGQFVDITEEHGVRLRPWALRWTSIGELDDMASGTGLELVDRFGDVDRRPFDPATADRHVSLYRRIG
ncbi:MAG: methyltransferase domain-containing protein [Actinomycetota bacterium]